MIINMVQTKSSFGAEYIFSSMDNKELFTAGIHLSIGDLEMSLIKNNQTVFILKTGKNQIINNLGKSSSDKEYSVVNIEKSSGDICGKISTKRVRKFFSGYRYYETTFCGEVLTCYEVGMGKEGLFVCIYIGDRQIALVEKMLVVNDNKDCYRIYISDAKYNEVVCFFSLYYDHTNFSNYNEVVYKKKEINYVYSLNKELKSKYNPKFKDMVKS